VRKVLKINDCLERKALLAAVAGTVCGSLQEKIIVQNLTRHTNNTTYH
jgi:hypothetical protein